MPLSSAVRENRRRKGFAATLAVLSALALAGPAEAENGGPGVGPPWVVGLGDSYMSGEAGRWAGNSNIDPARVDRLGPTAYFDAPGGQAESIAGCHRASSAQMHIGVAGVNTKNFACSGAKTKTEDSLIWGFKPGVDSYTSGTKQGQVLMLQNWATTHNVKMIVLSIGGNDFNFGGIVRSCVFDFLGSTTLLKDFCQDDGSVLANINTNSVVTNEQNIRNAIWRISFAMNAAGYANNTYTILVQNYPSPLATSTTYRYGESGSLRQSTGGCGFWNADADWANTRLLGIINSTVQAAITGSQLPSVKLLNVKDAFVGRRLCENTVGLLEERGLTLWSQPNAVDLTEWVNQIRTTSVIGSPYYVQESLHPNNWGQRALRSCVRQAWNAGVPRGGTCTRNGPGLVSAEPSMILR